MSYDSTFGLSRARTAAGAKGSEFKITGLGRSERWPSYAAKKNTLSLRIGPPNVPPNWLICPAGRGRVGSDKIRIPCIQRFIAKVLKRTAGENLFVPDFVTTLITAPAARPNSAEKPF